MVTTVETLLPPVETWGSADRLSSVWGVGAYAERSIRKILPLLSRMNDTQLYIHVILLTPAMYRYTTRNVHLHGQLSTFNYFDSDIQRCLRWSQDINCVEYNKDTSATLVMSPKNKTDSRS